MAAGIAAIALAAQQPAVRGVVVAPNGRPIAGAAVASGAARALTAPDGQFQLSSPASQLTVTADGYAPATVASGPGLRIVLQLAPLAESVTVAATGRNQSTAAVPLTTAVVGRARLATSAAPNLDSILRQVSDLGTFRANSSLTANPTTQGVALLGTGSSGASRALVLLDGLPLNDFYGGWVDWLRVPDEAVESVSVVSGGASPLYGNDALSGVIGIATAAPTATHLDLRAGGGGMGTAYADGSGVFAAPHLAFALRGRGIRAGGYVPASPAGAVDTDAGVAAQNWAPELRWLPSPRAMFTLSSEYFAENRRNGTVLQTNATRLRQLALAGDVDRAGVWSGNVFYQSEGYIQNFSAIAPDRSSEQLTLEQHVPARTTGAALDWTWSAARWSLTAGSSYTHVAATDTETTPASAPDPARAENGRQRLAGAFIEASWSPRADWTWTATLRRDQWRNFDAFQATPAGVSPFPARAQAATSPALGTVWTPRPWLALHASVYTAFRAPTLNELYRPFRTGNVLTEANPLLAAERYRGGQAGADLRLGRAFTLQSTYFDGTVNNPVTSVTLSSTPALITRQRQNLGQVRSQGLTTGLQWAERPWLRWWVDYTYSDARVLQAPAPSLVGLRPAHVPANSASARAYASRGAWTASAVERFGGLNFDDDQNLLPLASYWTTDLYLSRGFGRWAPFVAAENLFNRRYAIERTPGVDLASPRALTAGVRLQLGGR
ncbi:MAG: TonB-dependent receptor [Terriglobales bacterium]